MTLVCDKHNDRFGGSAIASKDRFFKKWKYKIEFSATLAYVLQHALTQIEYKVIIAMYRDSFTSTEIKERFNLDDYMLKNIVNDAIYVLSSMYWFKQLYIGKEDFAKMMSNKIKEINDII